MISRRDGVMHYYKSIATGGYYANVFMSANTTVGSIFFNSGLHNLIHHLIIEVKKMLFY